MRFSNNKRKQFYLFIFLILKWSGGVNPALLLLCHTKDLRDFSWCPGVPSILFTLNMWVLSEVLNTECAVSVNSPLVYFIVFLVH